MSCRTGALAFILSIAATAAVAQPQDGPSGSAPGTRGEAGPGLDDEPYSTRALLLDPRVQKGLKLSDAQGGRLKAVEARRAAEMARFKQEFQERTKEQLGDQPDPRAVAELEEGVRPAVEAMTREHEAAMVKVLDRGQRARFGQIQLQAEGPVAFTRPEVQRRLNLAPAQVQAIMARVAAADDEVSRAAALSEEEATPDLQRPADDEDRARAEAKQNGAASSKARDAMATVRGPTMRAIAKVLTKGQREKYRKMLGEPFDFKGTGDVPKSSKPKTGSKGPAPD